MLRTEAVIAGEAKHKKLRLAQKSQRDARPALPGPGALAGHEGDGRDGANSVFAVSSSKARVANVRRALNGSCADCVGARSLARLWEAPFAAARGSGR